VTKFSAAARVAHDLALAACFGGTLFGKVAFNPSVGVIVSKPERGRLGGTTWNRFNVLNAVSFGLAVTTWLMVRPGSAGEQVDRRTRDLVLAKDVLLGAAASAGLAAIVAQLVLYRQAPQGSVPLESGGVPASEASARAALLQRTVSALGSVEVALFGALVAVTALLSEEAG
jgi:hypothetical protein